MDRDLTRRAQMTTEELLEEARLLTQKGDLANILYNPCPLAGCVVALRERAKICGTCLGETSDHTNEIVECDGCGVAVHEACYGIQV